MRLHTSYKMWVDIVSFEWSHTPPAEETSTYSILIELIESLASCWRVPMSKNPLFSSLILILSPNVADAVLHSRKGGGLIVNTFATKWKTQLSEDIRKFSSISMGGWLLPYLTLFNSWTTCSVSIAGSNRILGEKSMTFQAPKSFFQGVVFPVIAQRMTLSKKLFQTIVWVFANWH